MAPIQPFKINVSEDRLSRLKQKLALADLPNELDQADWDYGAPLKDVKRLVQHWQDGFDWRKAEAKLNELPQYTTDIDVDGFETLRIHFVHQKSDVQDAIPLIFVHGWPGSFVEVSKILPELVKGGGNRPAFHVVAPSLVNFGFSQGTSKRGFTSKQHAEVCHKLMQALGYEQYVTQGGDIGTAVTRGMGLQYPSACKGSHLNMFIPAAPSPTLHPDLYYRSQQKPLDADELAGIERTKWFREQGYGYNLEQQTKPQTIGYSMTDSPVGLLAWIYEKLHDWTDAYPWTDDEVLTWISIYYFSTAGPGASQRIYYESNHDPEGFSAKAHSSKIPHVKYGVVRFPKELFHTPKLWVHTFGDVVYESGYHEKGGHFAAHERPDVIVDDLRKMFGKGGPAYAVVHGRTGY